MRFLITGGAGYIGSHTVLELLQAGHEAVVLDNLCNSSMLSLQRVQQITGVAPVFVEGDVCDRAILDRIFSQHEIDGVLHFAGLKAVGESVKQPLPYYQNNVSGSITLCQAMASAGVYRLVFSSSATVYGDPVQIPLVESSPLGTPTNAYGTSKLMVEKILQDMAAADPRWSVALLRYFNPVGAHQSGLMGEDPNGLPENLLPYISRVAVGKLERLSIYGNDYPTPDGTGVRDYIHVVDLAKGHIAAVNYISQHTGINAWNLGTGVGYSVLEMIRAFEDASGCTIPYTLSPRRQGDIAQCWSDPSKALHDLGWKAERGLKEMMEDTWRWQSNNPDGYRSFE
ncbi:UDP-glucose 4-epimerase GalE [Pseudomonas protegens]|jgi:UDP-glucose 4-epimerase|uniref:UDP-glucose 4-epimerase n=9 Tax=Pseudomonas protegens TaxID=380021 RepID=Q4K5L0_PSEF5|nr:UDP-glucose 4-epimerase GalE [Pseudomonas protegens]AAY94615.1 UDP-glucose 4-epimerase [Pseudomonas protegens Pf-5]ASE21228.1 UDP-glucose 4-epimerase GalE [Pseudomonas protegens]MBP5100124.1 UDP-glucose 4-epimerase GalE [Pseudomonas protegens]PNV96619.1 UDP-glucose 4-epimerase GalE [Pseudomonas protegens]QEZ49207.1 UDP-glucose 4-epimerase GalE [Pseudomonas protegens]